MSVSEHVYNGPERRQAKRFILNSPAILKVATSETTGILKSYDVMIHDISQNGFRISLTTDKTITSKALAKIFTRSRPCYLVCRLPKENLPARWRAEIMWVDMQTTWSGVKIYMGVRHDHLEPQYLSVFSMMIAGISDIEGETAFSL